MCWSNHDDYRQLGLFEMKNLEEQFYEIAGLEVAERRLVAGLMAKAFSEADGDERKAVARYIKYRVSQLSKEHHVGVARQEAEAKNRRAAEAAAKKQQQDRSRKCCWNCVSFECTGWLDKTKGKCLKHQRKTLAYELCDNHEWKVL
jgi:hypothetical protein